jgi:hypothetical protein
MYLFPENRQRHLLGHFLHLSPFLNFLQHLFFFAHRFDFEATRVFGDPAEDSGMMAIR